MKEEFVQQFEMKKSQLQPNNLNQTNEGYWNGIKILRWDENPVVE